MDKEIVAHQTKLLIKHISVHMDFEHAVNEALQKSVKKPFPDNDTIIRFWLEVLNSQEIVGMCAAIILNKDNKEPESIITFLDTTYNAIKKLMQTKDGLRIFAAIHNNQPQSFPIENYGFVDLPDICSLFVIPCPGISPGLAFCASPKDSQMAQIVQSFVDRIAVSASVFLSIQMQEEIERAFRQMASRIAHLTSTPLALAKKEFTDCMKDMRPEEKQKLSRAEAYLDEANMAIERAFMFASTAETSSTIRFDIGETIRLLAKEIGMKGNSNAAVPAVISGNPFRVRYAIRDLFYCAKTLNGLSYYSFDRLDADVRLRVTVPGISLADMKPEMFFSPQYHIEAEDINLQKKMEKRRPPGISLFLCKQLISETNSRSSITASLNENRGCIEFLAKFELFKGEE